MLKYLLLVRISGDKLKKKYYSYHDNNSLKSWNPILQNILNFDGTDTLALDCISFGLKRTRVRHKRVIAKYYPLIEVLDGIPQAHCIAKKMSWPTEYHCLAYLAFLIWWLAFRLTKNSLFSCNAALRRNFRKFFKSLT